MSNPAIPTPDQMSPRDPGPTKSVASLCYAAVFERVAKGSDAEEQAHSNLQDTDDRKQAPEASAEIIACTAYGNSIPGEGTDSSSAKRQLPQIHRMWRLNGKQHRSALHFNPTQNEEPTQPVEDHRPETAEVRERSRQDCISEATSEHNAFLRNLAGIVSNQEAVDEHVQVQGIREHNCKRHEGESELEQPISKRKKPGGR